MSKTCLQLSQLRWILRIKQHTLIWLENFDIACMKAKNTYLLHLNTTLMHSHCQSERHLLLSTSSSPSTTCLKRNITNHNFVIWTMRHQSPSKTSLSRKQSTTDLLHRNNIESVLQNLQFRISKII